MMNAAQATALATLATRLRPDWDQPGVMAAIHKTKNATPAQIAAALCLLADNPEARTPGMLPLPGKHWQRADGEPVGPAASHDVPCPVHPKHSHPCPACKQHTHQPTIEAMEALYAALGTTRQAAHTRAAQCANQPPRRTRRTQQ